MRYQANMLDRKALRAIIEDEAASRPIQWKEEWRLLSSVFAVDGPSEHLEPVLTRLDHWVKSNRGEASRLP